MMTANWRLKPSTGQQIAVERIARREQRSVSNTLRVLVAEALMARNEMPRPMPEDRATCGARKTKEMSQNA